MLFPERMQFINVMALKEDDQAVTRALAGEGSFHIVDQRTQPVCDALTVAGDDGTLTRAYEAQMTAVSVLLSLLGGSPDEEEPNGAVKDILSRDSGELLAAAREAIETIHADVDAVLQRRREIEAKIDRLDSVSEEMHLLDDYQLSFRDVSGMRRLYTAFGILPRPALEELRSRLQDVTYHLVDRRREGAALSVLLVGDPAAAEQLGSSLAQAGFRAHNIPERFLTDADEALDLVEQELWTLRDELAEMNREYKAHRRRWLSDLTDWARSLSVHHKLLEAMKRFSSAGQVTIISGFIPAGGYERLLSCLESAAPGRHFVETYAAEEGAAYSIPTKLKNWALVRPFELFVKNYGLPRYNDIDPTVFVAASFLLMFGMMFGDVGHGLILAGIGACIAYLPYRVLAGMRALGKILLMAGLSGVLFGFLFGSVFGVEEDTVLPALWMRPTHQENLVEFLGTALVIGIGIISLGIVLGIVQALRQGNRVKAWIGQWSISSLAFYWMMLALVGGLAVGQRIPLPRPLIALVMALPLLIIVGGQFVAHRLGHGGHDGEAFEAATVLFEPIEIVMNLFTNSVSFLRVAAFGLAHAALMMATFIIKDMMRAPGVDVLGLPVEHLFIIALEGMIVTIQCLRLEYYEFFSKFYNGDGVAYAPLAVHQD